MAKNSTRYVIITLLMVVGLLVLILFLKRHQRSSKVPAAPPVAFDYLPFSANQQIIRHAHFTLAYSEKDEQAEWVAYELTREEVLHHTERSDNFREDPLVTTGSASPDDYRRSGYDRGHLAPAGDMGISEEAMSESFYMSNISPQVPTFNRGIWKDLEEDVRKWVVEDASLYVVTGPVLTGSNKKIGTNNVTVPVYFYKVLLDYHEPDIKAIAFLLPNKRSNKALSSFAVSIDEVERLTGIDFFPALPDALENILESEVRLAGWFN